MAVDVSSCTTVTSLANVAAAAAPTGAAWPDLGLLGVAAGGASGNTRSHISRSGTPSVRPKHQEHPAPAICRQQQRRQRKAHQVACRR